MPSRRASLARSRRSRTSRGAWVKDQKVIVKDGKIAEYRVALKVTFILTTDDGAGTGASRPVALVLCLRTLLHEPCRHGPT
jgi:hypothetical protein